MKTRKRESLLDKFFTKLLCWAVGKAIESLPVVGPIFRVISLACELRSIAARPTYSAA